MSEPVITQPNTAGTGAPELTDEQYQRWLDDMAPFLKQGSSLYYALDKCGLYSHKDSIYKKYKLNDWFSEKVDAYRSMVGDMINNVGFKIIESIHTRMIESGGKALLSSEEVQVWKTMAEKHRSAQPFFVTRTETAEADPKDIGKILDNLDTDYDKLADNARRAIEGQVVAPNTPLQDKGQAGAASDVSTQSNPNEAHN